MNLEKAIDPPAADRANDSHVVSWSVLIATCVALLVLTWLTVAVSRWDLGGLNVTVALGVAVLKSTIVALYFMHLRWDRPFNRLVIVSALLLLLFFIVLCTFDGAGYRLDVLGGDAPLVQETLKSRGDKG